MRLPVQRATRLLAATAVLTAGLSSCSSPPPQVTLTAAGDYGASDSAVAVLQAIGGIGPDAHLALGDLSYGDVAPESAWCDLVNEHVDDVPFQLLAGNHDTLDNPDGDIAAFADCLPNRLPGLEGDYGREYAVDLPAAEPLVRVIAVSPGLTFEDGRWDYRNGDPHYTWTRDAITDARASGIPWVAVAAHIPCWSLGVLACPTPPDLYRLLLEQRVDLVLHGHEHGYSRTRQLSLDCPAETTQPCPTGGVSPYPAGAGPVFATVGTGGIELRPPQPGDPDASLIAASQYGAHGVLTLTITSEALLARFVAVDGSVRDDFQIVRGGG